MRKDAIRREVLKARLMGYAYKGRRHILVEGYAFQTSIVTLKRWWKRFNQGDWNLRDISTRPQTIHNKFSDQELGVVISLRRWGYSAYQLKRKLKEKGISMSESMIKSVIKASGLSRGNKMEGKRLKWIRFERDTPNSMWQLDGTQLDDGNWLLPIEDDCSRYCIAMKVFASMTTAAVIQLLEQAIAMHGKPREILTDNGSEFGGNGKGDNAFDTWCEKQGIIHIRSGIHKPTTVGKISRLQFTITYELPYCQYDYEHFRWRYNHERPHRSLNGLTPAEVYFGFMRHKKYKLDESS